MAAPYASLEFVPATTKDIQLHNRLSREAWDGKCPLAGHVSSLICASKRRGASPYPNPHKTRSLDTLRPKRV
jgi:hypothetical protein